MCDLGDDGGGGEVVGELVEVVGEGGGEGEGEGVEGVGGERGGGGGLLISHLPQPLLNPNYKLLLLIVHNLLPCCHHPRINLPTVNQF